LILLDPRTPYFRLVMFFTKAALAVIPAATVAGPLLIIATR
jgi:hypothetical protein